MNRNATSPQTAAKSIVVSRDTGPNRLRISIRSIFVLALAASVILITLLIFKRPAVPLAEVEFSHGTKLSLLRVSDAEEPFVLRPPFPASLYLRQFTGELIRGRQSEMRNETGTVCWLRMDPSPTNAARPDWFGHAVIVDQDGWPHVNLQSSFELFHDQGSELQKDNTPFLDVTNSSTHSARSWGSGSSASPKMNVDTLIGLWFPRLPGQSATLRIYNSSQQLVAELPIQIPASPRTAPDKSPPVVEKLPTTRESQGLTMTLNGLRAEALPEKFAGYRQFTLKPDISLSWQGGGDANMDFPESPLLEVIDCCGLSETGKEFSVSPFSPVWKINLTIPRNSRSPILPDQTWISPELRLPSAGEAIDLTQEFALGETKVRLHKLLSRGRHRFQLPEFPLADVYRATSPNGTIQRADGTWTIEYSYPTLLFSSNLRNDSTSELTFRFESAGKIVHQPVFGTNYRHGNVGLFFLTPLPADAKSLILQAVVTEPLTFQFLVDPRQLDLGDLLSASTAIPVKNQSLTSP